MAMTKPRDGHRVLFAQVPAILMERLEADAERRRESAAKTITRILQRHYRVSDAELPAIRKAGRPRKNG